jgi:Prophage CP4-57 regulatory protein (AlpA)
MFSLLRFRDLKDRGIVNSWPQLKRLIELHGFPKGRLLSPNTRAWLGTEIDAWINSRPVEGGKLRGAAKAKHARKVEQAAGQGA